MTAALTLWAFAAAVLVLMLVVGFRLAIGGVRLAIWMISTKAGWVTAGILFVAYLLFW